MYKSNSAMEQYIDAAGEALESSGWTRWYYAQCEEEVSGTILDYHVKPEEEHEDDLD